MAVNLSPVGGVAGQFFDNNGNPLSGGKIFTYAAGTTTNQVTYTSATGITAHSNPIILDSGGRVPSGEIWLTDGLQYKFVIKTSTDQLIGTFDNVTGINSNFVNYTIQEEIQIATAGQTVFTLTTMSYAPATNSLSVFVDGVNQYGGGAYSYIETDSTTVTFTAGLHVGAEVKFTTAVFTAGSVGNAANVVYDPAGIGAVPTNVQDKLRETVSVKDFGAVGDGVADDTAAIQAAIDYATSVGAAITLNGAEYLCNGQLLLETNTTILGPGKLVAGVVSGFPVETHLGFLYGLVKNNILIKDVEIDISAWAALPAGVASFRAVLCRRGIGFRIEGCKFTTTGGGPAFIGCKDIIIERNIITAAIPGVSVNGFADGMIDVWVEFDIDAERCIISNNIIKANGYGRWGIMATGTTVGAQFMEVKSFVVSGNIVEDTYFDGIWVFGRNALLDGITVTGNVIKNARQGIRVSDATNFTVVGNAISNITEFGIHLFSEPSGTFGASGGVVNGNVLKDVASSLSGTPAAIYVVDNSEKNVITNNTVIGTAHFHGVLIGATAVDNLVASNNIEKGRSSNIVYFNNQTKYDGAVYTPTLTIIENANSVSSAVGHATISSQMGRVNFRLNVTPTTAGVRVRVGISLPYPSNIISLSLFGLANTSQNEAGFVFEDITNDIAILNFVPSTTTERQVYGSFSYLIN